MAQQAGVRFSDEREWAKQCADRAAAGYNSGIGEIFWRVGMINPIAVGGGESGAKELGGAWGSEAEETGLGENASNSEL